MTKPAGWTAAAVAPDRALPGGTRIDDYEIEQTLAESGVAIVYRSLDHALGLQVALEEYMPEALALRSADARVVLRTRAQGHAFDEGRQAFVGEARTLARCEHPALLRVDRVLQRNGTVYRVMRLATGPTLLAHRRAQTRPPDAATLQRWLDDLLGALAALHAEGCVHGAVAPGRILLRDNGHLLLLGFDAVRAKLISGRTQEMMAALEPCFSAPEQRRPTPAQVAGPWTDLYALAATLRFCIDGELPPPATGLAAAQPAALASAAWQRVQPASAADAPWLRPLDACLAEAPQDRPQSVAGLRRMIDEAVFASTLPAWPAPRIAPAPSNDPAMPPPEDRAGATDAPSASAEPASVATPAPAPVEDTAAAESVPAPGAVAAPTVASAAESGPARDGESVPADAPPATDAAIAHMLADLDQTLARVAAMAQEEADPKRTPAAPARAGEAAADAAAGPGPALEPGLGSGPGAVAATAVAQGQGQRQAHGEGQGQAQAPTRQRRDRRAPWPRNAALWLAAAGAAVLAVAAFGLLRVNEERSSARLAASDAAPAAEAIASPSPAAMAANAQPVKPQPAAAAGTQRADDPGKRPVAPVAANTGAAPAAPQVGAATRPQPAPRTQCTGKSGYALFQCMQTQCAKRSYAKHPQCVRLLRDHSLN